MCAVNEFRYINNFCVLTIRCIVHSYVHTIVDMSERCIHCGASERNLIQPEYANWVCRYDA